MTSAHLSHHNKEIQTVRRCSARTLLQGKAQVTLQQVKDETFADLHILAGHAVGPKKAKPEVLA